MAELREVDELRAEVMALHTLLLAIAPVAFATAGVSVENVEALSTSIISQLTPAKTTNSDQDVAAQYCEAVGQKIQELFDDVAESMRVRAEGNINIAS